MPNWIQAEVDSTQSTDTLKHEKWNCQWNIGFPFLIYISKISSVIYLMLRHLFMHG